MPAGSEGALAYWSMRSYQPWQAGTLASYEEVLLNGHPTLAFNDAAVNNSYFSGRMPQDYADGDFEVSWSWVGPATTGDVVWQFQIERWTEDSLDIDTDNWTSLGTSTVSTATGSAFQINLDTKTLSQATAGILKGEGFGFRVQRLGGNGSDTMVGDASLLTVALYEV